MNITPIPEQEAADLIGVSLRTIRNAIKRGDLRRIPVTGLVQHIAKEHAELFRGMKWVVKENLSSSAQREWAAINNAIASPNISRQETQIDQSLEQQLPRLEPTIGKERFTQDVPFLVKRDDPILMEAIRLMQQMENNRQMDQAYLQELMTAYLRPVM